MPCVAPEDYAAHVDHIPDKRLDDLESLYLQRGERGFPAGRLRDLFGLCCGRGLRFLFLL